MSGGKPPPPPSVIAQQASEKPLSPREQRKANPVPTLPTPPRMFPEDVKKWEDLQHAIAILGDDTRYTMRRLQRIDMIEWGDDGSVTLRVQRSAEGSFQVAITKEQVDARRTQVQNNQGGGDQQQPQSPEPAA